MTNKSLEITVKLGDKVVDDVSGFTGVIASQHDYLHGCRRFTVQPAVDKDGKLPDPSTFDGPQLSLVEPEKVQVDTREQKTGGPSKYEDNGRR